MPAHTHKADAHFVAHKALHARSTCAIQNLRKNTDTQLQVPSKKVHGEPSSTKNMVCRAAVAHALLKGTLILSQIQALARGLLERIITLVTRAIPELQGSSKKAHVEPSSSQNKLWTPKTTSAARKSTVLGRNKRKCHAVFACASTRERSYMITRKKACFLSASHLKLPVRELGRAVRDRCERPSSPAVLRREAAEVSGAL